MIPLFHAIAWVLSAAASALFVFAVLLAVNFDTPGAWALAAFAGITALLGLSVALRK